MLCVLAFDGERYTDEMRTAVMACISAGVGVRRIGPLLQLLTQAITNRTFSRMPATSTIALWAGELRTLSRIQTVERLTRDEKELQVLASDGTTKFGKKFGAFRYAWIVLCCATLLLRCAVLFPNFSVVF